MRLEFGKLNTSMDNKVIIWIRVCSLKRTNYQQLQNPSSGKSRTTEQNAAQIVIWAIRHLLLQQEKNSIAVYIWLPTILHNTALY